LKYRINWDISPGLITGGFLITPNTGAIYPYFLNTFDTFKAGPYLRFTPDFRTMAPLCAGRLEAEQATIIATLDGSLSVRLIRLGPRPGKRKLRIPSDGRRMIGGPNERAVLQLFADFRR